MTNSNDSTRIFFQKVYGWMFAGMLISGLAAFMATKNSTLNELIYGNGLVMFGLIIFELILVLIMSFLIRKMSSALGLFCFILFSFVNGLTLSVIFLAYSIESITFAFIVTAGMFGLTSLYGYITKADLSSLGSILIMGLIGIIIATLVNVVFVHSSSLDYILSIITVLVFTGLTAYDTQKLKRISQTVDSDIIKHANLTVTGALSLYLDFINLFLSLLRIFGKQK